MSQTRTKNNNSRNKNSNNNNNSSSDGWGNDWDNAEVVDIVDRDVEVYDDTMYEAIISSKQTLTDEIHKLLQKNYDLRRENLRFWLSTKIENITGMLTEYANKDREKSPTHFIELKDPSVYPVFDAKFFVYEDSAKDMKTKSKDINSFNHTWTENNAHIKPFSDFLNAYEKYHTRRNAPGSVTMSASLESENHQAFYDLFSPFTPPDETLITELNTLLHDKDAFVFLDVMDPEFGQKKMISVRRLLGPKYGYNGDKVLMTGLFVLNKGKEEKERTDNYATLDLGSYMEGVDAFKEGDRALIYPHDYISLISHDGDVRPKSCIIKKVTPSFLELELTNKKNESTELFYNKANLRQNRFMLFSPKVKDPMTKYKTKKQNTFVILNPNHDIFDQVAFINDSPSTMLFNAFKKIKKLSALDVEKLMAQINYDQQALSPLARHIFRLIRENLRKTPKGPLIRAFQPKRNPAAKNTPPILKGVNHAYLNQFLDSPLFRTHYLLQKYDGGLLEVLQNTRQYLESVLDKPSSSQMNNTAHQKRETTKLALSEKIAHLEKEQKKEKQKEKAVTVFNSFPDLFAENERLRLSLNTDNAKEIGIVLDAYKNPVYLKKTVFTENSVKYLQWILEDDITHTERFVNNHLLFIPESLENQKQVAKAQRDSLTYKEGVASQLRFIREEIAHMITMRQSSFSVTPFYKLENFRIDLSHLKKNFTGKELAKEEQLLQIGEDYNSTYSELPEQNVPTLDDDENEGTVDEEAFNVAKNTILFIEKVVKNIARAFRVGLGSEDIKWITKITVDEYDESRLLKDYEAKTQDLIKFEARVRRAGKDMRLYEKNLNATRERNSKEHQQKMIMNRRNTLTMISALLSLVVLIHRPKNIMLGMDPVCARDVKGLNHDDVGYYVRYFACYLKLLTRNIHESLSDDNAFFPYLEALGETGLKTREQIADAILNQTTIALRNRIIREALERSNVRVAREQNKHHKFVSTIDGQFRPFLRDMINKQETGEQNLKVRRYEELVVDYVMLLQNYTRQQEITKKTENLYKFAHDPTACCYELISQYGTFVSLDPQKLAYINFHDPLTKFSVLPRLVRRKMTARDFVLHPFWGVNMDFTDGGRQLRRSNIKTYFTFPTIREEDRFGLITRFFDVNPVLKLDGLAYEYFEHMNTPQKDPIGMLSMLKSYLANAYENMQQFLEMAFPTNRLKRDGRGLLERWQNISKEMQLVQHDHVLFFDFIYHFVRDLLIVINREVSNFKLSDSAFQKKRAFLPTGTPARLFEIAETDMREMEMKKAQFSQKLVDAALQKISIFDLHLLIFPAHLHIEALLENHTLMLYVFITILKVMFHSIIALDTQPTVQGNPDFFNPLPEMVTLNENQKTGMADILRNIFDLYERRKSLTMVPHKHLNEEFEKSKDNLKKKRTKRIERNTKDEQQFMAYVRSIGLDEVIEDDKMLETDILQQIEINQSMLEEGSPHYRRDETDNILYGDFEDHEEAYDIPNPYEDDPDPFDD